MSPSGEYILMTLYSDDESDTMLMIIHERSGDVVKLMYPDYSEDT